MNEQASDPQYLKEELIQTAMVCFNISEGLLDSENEEIEIKADYRNHNNPYWIELWPFLDKIDPMTEDEISGRDVHLYWCEEEVLNNLSQKGILKYKTITITVEDIFETGRTGDLPSSYSITVYNEKFAKFNDEIIEAVNMKLTTPSKLRFPELSNPVITTGTNEYKLKSMRSGNAYDIVVYCLEKFPNETVSLRQLKEELSLSGVSNINEAIRKSHFDNVNGLLRSFVNSSPQFIRVFDSVELPISQLEKIIIASKTS